ncbi:MAG TPA: hypothetical protein VHO66_10445, partial [Ruminiclostridium sp.]|nr:hypothetical protein [Ruminiclostridium sp.]
AEISFNGCPTLKGHMFMIIRQLKPKQFESLHSDLVKKAYTEPLEASYSVNMAISGMEYAVRIQPETHNRIAVLQAYKIDRNGDSPHFELITSGNILSSLLEILIYQGV